MKTATQKTGRPNAGLDKPILFNVTESEKEQLNKYSKKMNVSKSELIRQALNEYINKHSQNGFTMPIMFK